MTALKADSGKLADAAAALDAGNHSLALDLLADFVSGDMVSLEKARTMRGVALFMAGDRDAACAEFQVALNAALGCAVVCWKNLAGLEFQAGQLTKALAHIENYRHWREFDKEAVLLHAAILVESKRPKDAREVLDSFLEAFPCDQDAQMLRIDTLILDGAWLSALYAIGRCIADHGDRKLLRIQRVSCYLNLGLVEAATRICGQLLPELDASDGGGLFIAGTLHLFRHEYEAAQHLMRLSLQCHGHPADASFSLGVALLSSGHFAEGYQRYMERKALYPSTRLNGVPEWRGEDVSGKRLLINWEQGLGDSIQYMRYVPLLAERGVRMVFNAQPELLQLLPRVETDAELVTSDVDASCFDYQLLLLDLPLLCGVPETTNIPAEIPYLYADPELLEVWAHRLSSLPGMRVGLAWAGNPQHVVDHFRSAALSDLLPLALIPGVSFVSLQLGRPAREVSWLTDDFPVLDLQEEIRDLADTAAIIANLDLVIAVDTAVAHLAGALGRKVWLMLPAWGTDWRWELAQDSTPWYPDARLFRQKRVGDWHSVAVEIRTALLFELSAVLSTAGALGKGWLLGDALPDRKGALQFISALSRDEIPWATRLAEYFFRERGSGALVETLFAQLPEERFVALAYARYSAFRGDSSRAVALWGAWGSTYFSAGDWLCRAQVAYGMGGAGAALDIFREALDAGRGTPTVLFEFGSTLASLGRGDEALDVFGRAIELVPRAVKSRRSMALECINKGRFIEAVEHLQRSVMLNPRYADAWLAIAGFARRQDLPALAVEILTGLGDVDAGLEGRFLLAETLAMSGDQSGAEQLLVDADDTKMNVLERSAYLLALKTVERWEKHDAVLDRWFACGMDDANSLLSYAWRKLQCGDYAQGWPAYRKAIPGRQTSIPSWQGECLDGKRILVYQDQGFGDLIQFFPLVHRLLELKPRLTFAVAPDMVALMKCQGLNATVVSLTEVNWSDSRFDFAVAQMHLPALLDIRLDEKLSEVRPILAAPHGLLPEWEHRMAADARLKVGIVWAGNPKYVNDAFRSTRLRDWRSLSVFSEVAWCCLQKDGASNQAFGASEFQFWNLAADCGDWLRTASIIQKLDLVISVDTGVAHLAAALGVQTWILLPPRVTDFRWQLEREDCPWYPSVRLFRRSMGESWAQVVVRVSSALQSLLSGKANQ